MWRIASLFWLLSGFGVHEVVSIGSGRRWDIWTTTGNIPEASSDSYMYVVLIDENGKESSPLYLDAWERDDFEANSQDHFIVNDEADIRDVCAIGIFRDNYSLDRSPNWFIEKVWMQSGTQKEYRNFLCNCWVPTGKEAKKIIERSPPCSAGRLS